MDFTGEAQLGDVVRIEGEFVVAFGVAESPEGDNQYRSPRGTLMTWFHLAWRRRKVL